VNYPTLVSRRRFDARPYFREGQTVITGLAVAFTASVALSVKKGIARISRFNMGVFAVLTVMTFLLGPPTIS